MKKIILLSVISLFFLLAGTKIVLAADCACLCSNGFQGKTASLDDCTVVCNALTPAATVTSCNPVAADGAPQTAQTLPNPLGISTINEFIARLITFILSLVGSISLLLFVYGGIAWMTSMGNSAQVKKGRDIVIWAVIGLLVVFTSYILVKFVILGITTGA
ncbi:MAG: hypothetical protein WCK59_03920 [Candidatus Falkowbacteria bacterium]